MGAAESLDRTGTLQWILQDVGPNEDRLMVEHAVTYLNHVGYKISRGQLYNRLSDKTGPACYKRGGRIYFKKMDLDHWIKQETEKRGIYGT